MRAIEWTEFFYVPPSPGIVLTKAEPRFLPGYRAGELDEQPPQAASFMLCNFLEENYVKALSFYLKGARGVFDKCVIIEIVSIVLRRRPVTGLFFFFFDESLIDIVTSYLYEYRSWFGLALQWVLRVINRDRGWKFIEYSAACFFFFLSEPGGYFFSFFFFFREGKNGSKIPRFEVWRTVSTSD